MSFDRVKVILTWGILLFIFNYIFLFIFMVLFGEKLGPLLFLPINVLSTVYASYRGVKAYSQISNKEKMVMIKSTVMLLMVGFLVVGVSNLLFTMARLLFSGEFVFEFPGILVGAIGGIIARQKIQGKAVNLFGVKF